MTHQLILADDTLPRRGSRNERELTLGAFGSMVWRRRLMVICILLLAIVCGLLRYLIATPSYIATARIYIQQSGPRLVGEHREQLAMAQNSDFAAAQADIVTSTSVLSGAAEKLGKLASLKGETDVLKHLRTRVAASQDKDTEFISVMYRGTDPEDAAAVANAVVEAYIAFERTERNAAAARTIASLESDRQERAAQLNARTVELVALQDKHGAMSLGNDYATVATDHLAKLSTALVEAQLEAVDARSVYEESLTSFRMDPAAVAVFEETRSVETFAGTSANEDAGTRLRMISVLQIQLREAKRLSGPNHPQVQAYRSQLEQLVMSHLCALKQGMLAAQEKVSRVEARLAEQQALVNTMTTTAVDFTRLKSEVTRLERLIDAINDRINQEQVAANSPTEMVRVIDAARPPTSASSPQIHSILVMSVGIGLVLSLGLTLVAELRRPRVRSVQHVQSLIEAPVLGIIPHLETTDPAAGYFAAKTDPTGVCAEAYRIVRTSLINGHSDRCMTIAMTSAQPGEGKSTVACNLAIVLAQTGRRVLLVDADLRNSRQRGHFGATNLVGLSDVVEGRAEWENARIRGEKLSPDYLPPGTASATPSELLGSSQFQELLARMQRDYDCVVVDTPPVGLVADGRVLAARCDKTVLVVRAEYTDPRRCEAAFQSLRAVGANVAGVVVNDVRAGTFGGYGDQQEAYPYRRADAESQPRVSSLTLSS